MLPPRHSPLFAARTLSPEIDPASAAFSTAQSLTPVQLSASSAQARREWLHALCTQIDLIRSRFATALVLEDVLLSKRLSKFISSPESLGTDEEEGAYDRAFPSATCCRLCLKAYHAIFRRCTTCEWCGERVCGECAEGRVRVPAMLHVHAAVQKHTDDAAGGAVRDPSPHAGVAPSPLPPGKSSFFSKASASVTSMGTKLRHAVSKLEAERDAAMHLGVKITVCDACHMSLTSEIEDLETMQRGATADDK